MGAVVSSKSITYNDQVPQRLDRFLTEQFSPEGYTRSYWNKMIAADFVMVNMTSKKSGYSLRKGDVISIQWPIVDISYKESVEIVHDDASVLVVNKPAGMLTHSKGAFNPEFTVADFIADHIDFEEQATLNTRAGIVHRLDRHTSGALLAAKNKHSQEELQKQFASRTIAKHYIAVIQGANPELPDVIDVPLGRDPRQPKLQSAQKHGRNAVTRIIMHSPSVDGKNTIVLLQPETGRTHQLRVHLAHIGYPILGDHLYGSTEMLPNDRFLLHATQLEWKSPETAEACRAVASVPPDMSLYMSDAGRNSITKHLN